MNVYDSYFYASTEFLLFPSNFFISLCAKYYKLLLRIFILHSISFCFFFLIVLSRNHVSLYDVALQIAGNVLLQSPFGCGSFADLLSAPYTDPTDAGSLPEELDPFPELQLGNPQGVPSVDESAQSQSVHHQQPSQPPPPPPPLPEDIQADSLRYANHPQISNIHTIFSQYP